MSLLPADPSAPTPSSAGGIPDRPGWKESLAAAAFYLGLAPLLRPFHFRRDDPFVQHHAAQALVTSLAFLAVVFGGGIYLMVLSYETPACQCLFDRSGCLWQERGDFGRGFRR